MKFIEVLIILMRTCLLGTFYFIYELQKDIFAGFAYKFELSHENEILAGARMKSASADEIFGFASDEIKSVLFFPRSGFHHEVISSNISGIYPVRKDGFS